MNSLKHILVLPQWYPNKEDIQLGGFIQQQVKLMSSDFRLSVVYVHPIENQTQQFEIVENQLENLAEIIVYYKQSKGLLRRFINYNRFKKAQKLGYSKIDLKIDLCHVHVPLRCSLLALKLDNSIPIIATEHWSGHLNKGFHNLPSVEKALYLNLLKKAKIITTVSEDLKLALKKNTGYDSVVIGNPISAVFSNQIKKNDSIKTLTVGDLNNKTKNYTGLLNAFSEACLVHKNITLDIIGDGPDKKLIEQTITDLNLSENVRLLGRKNQLEVKQAYQNYHFFVNCSRSETFGMAIAEAIASGRPVIATKSGGPEQFVNETNGVLIDQNDLNGFAKAIIKMTSSYLDYDPEVMCKTILDHYGETPIKVKWMNQYKALLT